MLNTAPAHADHPALDVEAIRAQFPILTTPTDGQPLIYLDSAASTQQPECVIDAVADYHRGHHANIHRGAYQLSRTATRMYEAARERVARFLNAADPVECLFTRGTTESINLVAATWGRATLQPGDEILISTLEHHSNIVPWQMVAATTGARLRVIPIDDAGDLDLDAYRRLLSPRTRLVAVNQVSNALGTINPVGEIIAEAHAAGALVLIDGAQWVAHGPTDVQALDADFYVFSGHKLYGPTGIGVLYGKRRLLESMPPYQGGGDMIERVTFEHTTYAGLPNRFEAGTPHISGAVGLAAAIDWVESIGLTAIGAHEQHLLRRATERLAAIPGLTIKGTARHKSGVVSWVMSDPPIATLDIGTALDLRGICIRTGHHCCQPLMDRLDVTSTARASFGVYNRPDEVEALAEALSEIRASASRQRHASGASQVTLGAAGESASPGSGEGTGPTLSYPAAVADSPRAAADEIAEVFELLPDWPMRHQHIIDLGDRLPPMPDSLKTEANAVHGCQSQVHIAARVRPGTTDVIEFLADSDANIVRGLIALLQQLYSGQRACDILAFDVEAFFKQIGLDQHLSLTRRNGLEAMVRRVRQLAGSISD
ncbi:SufS family cysteine desulfurase [Allochromatium vinosum]|uniref:SufS family cysteine desulfurase n=1 Tax=Allochromatium vinosum TaxID=1049 RepID=UPI0019031561|nr:SufS family cysteine desulfurase [Allochromatium vinosum]MBK1653161.1 cysteine desulfurase [Allochromatium vinosum]